MTDTAGMQELHAEVEALNASGRHSEALASVDRALAMTPVDPPLLVARGTTLYEWGRFREARLALLRACECGVRDPELFVKLGWSCLGAGNPGEAVSWMGRAVDADPESAKARFGFGVALRAIGERDRAIENFERALTGDPDHVDCLIQLGECRLEHADRDRAETLFRRAIAVRPACAAAWIDLCSVLDAGGRHPELKEALDHVDRLERESGEDFDNFIHRALALSDEGRLNEALELFERNLPTRPSARGHFIYATLLLRAGRLREGWDHYEFRWAVEEHLPERARNGKPVWTGQDLRGRTILLRREQGVGDLIQFARYAPLLKDLGATVWLQVRAGLAGLGRSFVGVDRVFEDAEPLPRFDYYAQLLSLPRIVGPDLDAIPTEVPYVRVASDRADRWAARLGDGKGLKVGLVWGGDPKHKRDRHRSIPLRMLTPLASVEGIRLFSLQKGPAATEAVTTPHMPLDDLSVELRDFGDTTAAIDRLDLVIAVDTAVAHLAGALRKAVWVLLPEPPDFRWLEGRDDSPWYPTMRLFRQTRRGDWSDVIGRVVEALHEQVRRNEGAVPSARRAASERAGEGRALPPAPWPPPADRPPFAAVAETRLGIVQYLPQDQPVGDSIRWYGEFLQPQVDLLARIVTAGATVLEVAAGVGAHSLALSGLVGESGHLVLYEPRPLHRRILARNVAANELQNVTLLTGSAAKLEGVRSGSGIAERLDQLRLDRLALLKVNHGCASGRVLEGASDTLWRLRPLLFFSEVGGDERTELAAAARNFGYRCWKCNTPLFNPANFNRREENIFGTRIVTAIVAAPEEAAYSVALEGCVEIS